MGKQKKVNSMQTMSATFVEEIEGVRQMAP